MKKKLALVMFAILAVVLAGCGGTSIPKINQLSDLQGKTIAALASSAPAKSIQELVEKYVTGVPVKEVAYYNVEGDVITAILSGKADGAILLKFETDYYTKRNSDLKVIMPKEMVPGGIVMTVRKEDEALKNQLNQAIATLKDNGKLKELADRWIDNLPANDEPANTEMAKISGARTIYVGVSGDYVPLDYIAADGKPAGYNVALLSEIGKMLNVNFELVSVDPQAKYASLRSKKIDVIFCQMYSGEIASLFNDKYVMTNPYYTDEGIRLLVKK